MQTEAPRAPQAVGFYPAIEALRGFAALAVCFFHLWSTAGWRPLTLLSAIGFSGWMGVDLFFAISGFVIGKSVQRHAFVAIGAGRARNPDYARVYWRSRAARILPLYIVTCAVYLALQPRALASGALLQIGTHAAFVHNLFPSTMMTINGVTWSLAVEAQLYLLAFLLVPVIAVQQPAVQWRAFGLAVAIALAVRALTFWATADPALRSHGSMQTPALLDGFMAGVLISLRLAGNDAAIPDRRAFARWVAALVVALSLLALAHYAYTRHMDNLHTVPYMSILHRSLVAAGCAGLVLAAVWLPHRLRVPSALLWLGRVSYGIYLWHGVLLFGLLDRFGAAWSLDAKAVFVLLGSLLLADASYRLVERPTQRWILRRFPTAAELAPRQDLRAP